MTFRRISLAFAVGGLVGCGASIQASPSDSETTDASRDAPLSDGSSGDAACINPTQGAACSAGDVACAMDGDPCCIGFVWACGDFGGGSGDTWTKEGLGCACQVDAAVDVAPADVRADAVPIDANPSSCPADWSVATSGDFNSLCDASVSCAYPEGTCGCEPFCGGVAIPDALGPHWACTPKRTDGCSDTEPKSGDACSTAGQSCTYAPCCVTTYTCTSGHWSAGPAECPA